MPWLQKLLGQIDAVDLSKPRSGITKGRKGDVAIAELPVWLQQFYELKERKLEEVRELIAKIGDLQTVHEQEKHSEETCSAHAKKMMAALDGLRPVMREQRLLSVIFDQELTEAFGEEIAKHPAFEIRDGTSLVGCEEGQRDTIGDFLRESLNACGASVIMTSIIIEEHFVKPDKKEETPSEPATAGAAAGA